MKYYNFILLFFFSLTLARAQGTMDPVTMDPWMKAQLKTVSWNYTFKGVLADFHPVTIYLASDLEQVVGYFIHGGDQKKHRLAGEWVKGDHYQLQERDDNDRLTGYLVGTFTKNELDMQWMAADQSRLFEVKAFPESLIRIKNFKPVAEWIEVTGSPGITFSIQKMDYGIVSGIASSNGQFSRFDGYCLDGTCSIWNTVIQVPGGAPIPVQMRQKDALNYRAVVNGVEYNAVIKESTPLMVRHFDNSMGFLDFVYPEFKSETYKKWLATWSDKLWTDGVNYLQTVNQSPSAGRLVHRSSGWVEILEDNDSYISGMITYINPGATRRTSFVWFRKDDVLIPMEELMNSTADVKKLSDAALKYPHMDEDEGYTTWINQTGFPTMIACRKGTLATTEFNMIYGDDIRLIPVAHCRDMIKRKYWNDLGW